MDTELLTDMAVFAAVVEHNGFSAAADALKMSKSNISRRVAALETRLQLTLMHRTTRKIGLTESGRVYYQHCARVMEEARAADAAISALNTKPTGLLSVSLPETLGRAFILPLLPEFLDSYPDIRLSLTFTNRNVDLIEEHCDIAVRKGVIDDESLCVIPLGDSAQFFYAAPGYLEGAPPLDEPVALQQHAFIAANTAAGPFDLKVERGRETTSVRIVPRVAVRDHEAILSLTLAGQGVALLPAWLARKHVSSGALVPVLLDCRGPMVTFNAVFHPHLGMAPNLRAFIDFLKHHWRFHRPWETEGVLTLVEAT
ncbi:LysR family transcriptional regulator [Breoghania sp. L-A4]|uniref:LysR family transcriptional regulator n=1 Tax=Breoghania sp. L-A4 TaxID=2304600 RepID=UPI0013C2FF88|nr:LysR family transcriptional regulator [Breoghania sp. L-A4]